MAIISHDNQQTFFQCIQRDKSLFSSKDPNKSTYDEEQKWLELSRQIMRIEIFSRKNFEISRQNLKFQFDYEERVVEWNVLWNGFQLPKRLSLHMSVTASKRNE